MEDINSFRVAYWQAKEIYEDIKNANDIIPKPIHKKDKDAYLLLIGQVCDAMHLDFDPKGDIETEKKLLKPFHKKSIENLRHLNICARAWSEVFTRDVTSLSSEDIKTYTATFMSLAPYITPKRMPLNHYVEVVKMYTFVDQREEDDSKYPMLNVAASTIKGKANINEINVINKILSKSSKLSNFDTLNMLHQAME